MAGSLNKDFISSKEYGSLQQVAAVILNKFYGQDIDLSLRENVTFKNMETGLHMHLRLDVKEDYFVIEPVGDLPLLSAEEMNHLLNNFKDDDLILKHLPADKFIFKGMGIGVFNDVTDLEVQSQLKNSVVMAGDISPNDFMESLQIQLRDYLQLPDIEVGVADLLFEEYSEGMQFSLSGRKEFKSLKDNRPDELASVSGYRKAYWKHEPVILTNLEYADFNDPYELGLYAEGYHSVMIIPLVHNQDKVTMIIEIGSKRPFAFNPTHLKKLKPIIELLRLGNDVYLAEFDNKVDRLIKSTFTSIHPSVAWRFEQIATKLQVQLETKGAEGEVAPVVFEDVYPLYGQVDIKNSSVTRNNAIREDLMKNLTLAIDTMAAYEQFIEFHLLDAYKQDARKSLQTLKTGYTSGLESSIVDLLVMEIHPLLKQLAEQFDIIPPELLTDYLAKLDPDLGLINTNRSMYEQSVNKINKTLSKFLDKEDILMQQTLPHYFEKYKTDGVEYNLYLGQSILEDVKFSPFHLKDFRLWQLVKTVDMTRLMADVRNELPIPLETSQLIFIFSSALSIRFRMDEKRFDVDGTYNVRYEILKKRIDKAVIKGSGERLTQVGKIAIVYLLDKDREEYLSYLIYMIGKGLIEEDIEDLELDALPGANGLRALRVTVKP